MHKTTECIVEFAVAAQNTTNAWKSLVSTTHAFASDYVSLVLYLEQYENEYMENYHASDPDAKKRNGQWKYSKYLPKAYTSAKSVLGRALDLKVDVVDSAGSIMGKTETEKAIQKAKGKSTTSTTSVDDMLNKAVNNLLRLTAMGKESREKVEQSLPMITSHIELMKAMNGET